MRFTFSTVVVIFILRKIKIITNKLLPRFIFRQLLYPLLHLQIAMLVMILL